MGQTWKISFKQVIFILIGSCLFFCQAVNLTTTKQTPPTNSLPPQQNSLHRSHGYDYALGLNIFDETASTWLGKKVLPQMPVPTGTPYGKSFAIFIYQLLNDNFIVPFKTTNAELTSGNDVIPPVYLLANPVHLNNVTITVDLDAFITATGIGTDWKNNDYNQDDSPLINKDDSKWYTTKFISQLLAYYLLPLDNLACFKVFASPNAIDSRLPGVGPINALLKALLIDQHGDLQSSIINLKYNIGMFDFDADATLTTASANYRYLPACLIFMVQFYYNCLARLEFKYYNTEGSTNYFIHVNELKFLSHRAYSNLFKLTDATFAPTDQAGSLDDHQNYNIFTALPRFLINSADGINPWDASGTGNQAGDSPNWNIANVKFHSAGIWRVDAVTHAITLDHNDDVIWKNIANAAADLNKAQSFLINAWQSLILYFSVPQNTNNIDYFNNLFNPISPSLPKPAWVNLLFGSQPVYPLALATSKQLANMFTGTGCNRNFLTTELTTLFKQRHDLKSLYQHAYQNSTWFTKHRDKSPLMFPIPEVQRLWTVQDFLQYDWTSNYFNSFLTEQEAIANEFAKANASTSSALTTDEIIWISIGATVGGLLLLGLGILIGFYIHNHKNKSKLPPLDEPPSPEI